MRAIKNDSRNNLLTLLGPVLIGLSFIFLSAFPLSTVVAQSMAQSSAQASAERNYPGGVDEEDLQVQAELNEPTAKMDRRTLERRVLDEIVKSNNQKRENSGNNTGSRN